VAFDVTNTGARPGAEVAQLYVGDPSARIKRPAKELKGFKKVRLAPGETQHVELPLDDRTFSYWDVTTHRWRIDPGKFVVYVGSSSEDTPLFGELNVR
jgi:beta-glucosidase